MDKVISFHLGSRSREYAGESKTLTTHSFKEARNWYMAAVSNERVAVWLANSTPNQAYAGWRTVMHNGWTMCNYPLVDFDVSK